MKKKFTFLMAALMLLAMFILPLTGWGQNSDVIDKDATSSLIGNTGSTTWTTITVNGSVSNAEYKIYTMGTSGTDYAMKWNKNGYLYMTSTYAGHKLKSVTITTTDSKNIGLYAQNSAYSSAPTGTALATIAASSTGTTYSFDSNSNYSFLALKGTTTSTFITNITIEWESTGSAPTTYNVTYAAGDHGSGTMTDPNSPYEEDDEVTLLNNTFEPEEGYLWNSWSVKDANDQNVTVTNGKFTMPASDVTVTAQWAVDPSAPQYEWVLTNLADLTSTDIFVIVGTTSNSSYSMANDGTSNPAASSVTIQSNKISSTVTNNIKWNISGNATDGYIFYPNGNSEKWLYCNTTASSSSNTNLRVGTGDRKLFVPDGTTLKTIDSYTARYWNVYTGGPDWRGYTGNSTSTTVTFYKRQVVSADPSLTITTPDELAYNATSGSIGFTINNPVNTASVHASVPQNSWLTPGTADANSVPFTCTANQENTERSVTVTLTYVNGEQTLDTKTVTVTQAAAPVLYSTIPALFTGATSTETSVLVTFNNWVVSGVSTNGKQVFVTDNSGNGFIIYFDSDMSSTFSAGNILSGNAVSCTLKTYNGAAEIINLDANDLTITTGGTVLVANIDMANLSGINTGALVSYNNLSCSKDSNNKYQLSDGSTTIQAYNTLYAFTELEAGKTYNVTGVYIQYNTTKEIAPRSPADIAEVQVQHNEYTLTVSNLVHVNTYVFDASDQTNPLLVDEGNVDIYDGTEVMISVDVDPNYVISSLIVDGSDVTSQIVADAYTFTMPTHAVTVTATAVESVTPLTPTSTAYVRISALSQLTDGCKVVIAARYNNDNTNGYRAMTAATTGKPAGTAFTSTTSNNKEILPSNITNSIDTYYWTVNVTDDGYTFTNASNQVIGWNSGTNFATGGDHTTWTITPETSNSEAMVAGYTGYVIKNGNTDTRAFALNGSEAFGPYSTTNLNTAGYNFCLDFFVYAETYTYTIEAYTVGQGTTENPTDGWYLISSPVNWNITPTASTGFITNTYDLYRFNQSGTNGEWENWQQHGFMLANGKGYLYANSAGTTLTFTGAPVNGTTKTVDLDYAAETEFSGVNLVGNPFPVNAITDKSYYVMNSARTGIEATAVSAGTAIAPFTGVIVVATGTGQSVTFTKQSQSSTGSTNNNGYVNIVLSQQVNRGNATLDKAVLSFNDGDELGKFYFGTQDANLYFAMSDKDYAIATAEAQGEMPVCFKANQDGEYTITINAEEVEMNYLHLIDNMTGADIDLLANPSYTFNATTTDYASRFRLVFKANGVDEISSENGNFAFMSNGQLIITNDGEALLQVVDITGRVISTESVNGTCSKALNAPAGVYVLRLINGETTKTQKIVVK